MTLSQEIVPSCDGMTQVLVWVNSNGSDPTGTTQLTLRSTKQNINLAQQTFVNANITKDNWLVVAFSPDWQSRNKLYLLTINGSSPNGIKVGYSLRPEYSLGKLYENNVASSQDMLFQYGCTAGLQKLWLGMK
jgi:hypothetical protein